MKKEKEAELKALEEKESEYRRQVDTFLEKDASERDVSLQSNKVIPVAFNKDHKEMISHMAMLFNQNHVAVPEKFDKLIISLKTCTVNEYTLDKESTSYDDLLDAMRLSLKAYKIT